MAIRIGRAALVVLILLASVALFAHLSSSCMEGLINKKATEKTITERPGLPDKSQEGGGSILSLGQEQRMFPGVPFGDAAAAQGIMGPATQGGGPKAPSASIEELLGFLQPLGSAPELSAGDGTAVGSTGLGGGGDMVGSAGGVGGSSGVGGAGQVTAIGVYDGVGAGGSMSTRAGTGAGGPTAGSAAARRDAQSALPKGIPKSQIPKGHEPLYILKSEIVPPVCPACPACPECPRPVCPKPDPSQCPPCPAPGRCPPPAFGCQRVPLYQNMQSGVLPSMLG
jgi:hypothetical protein